MKVFRADDAAERLGLSLRVLEVLEEEGRIKCEEKIAGMSYYSQVALDHLMHELHCAMQKASWSDMEARMESVEKQIEKLNKKIKKLADGASRIY